MNLEPLMVAMDSPYGAHYTMVELATVWKMEMAVIFTIVTCPMMREIFPQHGGFLVLLELGLEWLFLGDTKTDGLNSNCHINESNHKMRSCTSARPHLFVFLFT